MLFFSALKFVSTIFQACLDVPVYTLVVLGQLCFTPLSTVVNIPGLKINCFQFPFGCKSVVTTSQKYN
jgi:hypothetical protein